MAWVGSRRFQGHECSWNPDTEASRPFTKQYVESLRVKVQLLESQIAQLRVGPPMSPIHYPPEASSSSPLAQELLDDLQGSPYHPSGLLYPNLPSLPLATNHESFPTTSSYPSESYMMPLPSVFQYQYIFNIDPSVPFAHQPPEIQTSLYCQWDRHLPDLGQVQLTRNDHDELLSRYFNNGMSWLSGLVPDLFFHDMINSLSQQAMPSTTSLANYSPLLHCALLAFASASSEAPHIRANDTRLKFVAHAKNWLFDQFGDFHPTLLPSLTLLAEYHNGVGERNTGHMYLGMGVRAIRANAAPADTSAFIWYSWSVFVQEVFSALGSGRPNEMPAPKNLINYPIEQSGNQSSLMAESFIRSCSLAVIAAEVNKNMPTNNSGIPNLQLQLDSWFNSLPDRLLVTQRTVFTHSHVLCLHICYWWTTLRLYLPLYKQGLSKDSSGETNGDRFIKMCHSATENLVLLFNEFGRRYNMRYFPENLLQAIVLCGDALLLERTQVPNEVSTQRTRAQDELDSCVRALQLAGETWHYALHLATKLKARSS